jgi:hypothetical protein
MQEAMLHLRTAHLILLLVSPDFLASDYVYEVDFKLAMERHQRGEAIVIPIIVRPVDWKHDPIGKLQVLPPGGKPVTSWSNQDEGLLSVVEGIREVVEELRKMPRSSLSKEKGQDLLKQPLQKVSVETPDNQDEQGIPQLQQALALANTPQAPQSKYAVHMSNSKGIVIGDHAQVTLNFHEKQVGGADDIV